jgi:hypothetical protein
MTIFTAADGQTVATRLTTEQLADQLAGVRRIALTDPLRPWELT